MLRKIGSCARAALASAAVLAVSAAAQGAFVLNFTPVADNDPDNVAIGLAQLTWGAEEIDPDPVTGATRIAFTLGNTGPDASSITRIYFTYNHFNNIESTHSDHDGVSFAIGFGPPVLPGGKPIGFETNNLLRVGALPPVPKHGVNPGESVVVVVVMQEGLTFFDALVGLNDGSIRIGLHVQAFENGGSESFVNEQLPDRLVPTPGAAALLAFAGLAALRRRR